MRHPRGDEALLLWDEHGTMHETKPPKQIDSNSNNNTTTQRRQKLIRVREIIRAENPERKKRIIIDIKYTTGV